MFSKLKFKIVVGVLIVAIGIFVSTYLDNHSFVSNKFIEQKTDSIKTLKKVIVLKDSLFFDCRQTSDITTQQLREQQIIIAELKKQLIQAKNDCTQANEAIAHYEENGLMRFFVYEKKNWFLKGCYKEVFQKPENICK
jgi:septal ring factor EnvC (AmiA/AmiB activator)